ncbi:TPA: hypothetical protein QDC06_000282 [Burkholderia cepacia]|nr:hypothetical protein [Burkholderia cepacia]
MELVAAPIVRKPIDVIGSPGMTDFVRIYIASELNKPEYRTTLRHEQGHVWAGHNRRRPKRARDEVWKIACEMEIARTIYDDRDIENINAPRSRLAGGYLPDSIDGLPDDIVLAEEIYEWLMDQPEQKWAGRAMCCACQCDGEPDESGVVRDISSVVKAARNQLDKDEATSQSQVATASTYVSIRNRPPTLTNAVDAALRMRIERERSHRRPSRRHDGENIILPGAVSVPRPPLVEIFVDRSGSFTPEKTGAAEQQLRIILARYGSTISADVWFFGNGKLVEKDPGGGGNTPYDLISQHIAMTAPKLAIVITDDDLADASVMRVDRRTTVLCVPIGCRHTSLAAVIGGKDVEPC